QSIMDELPIVTYKLTRVVRRSDTGQLGALEKLRNMSEALKKAASATDEKNAATGEDAAAPAIVVAKEPGFNLNDWLLEGSLSAAQFAGQTVMVLFLVFFALLSGNTFKRKLVKLTGPSLSDKKITVHILEDINTSIQLYMFMLLVTNV